MDDKCLMENSALERPKVYVICICMEPLNLLQQMCTVHLIKL